MQLDETHITQDGDAVVRAVPPESRYVASPSSRAPLSLARLQKPSSWYSWGADGSAADAGRSRPAGEFVVRRERQADTWILWLGGTLDRATSALLNREIDMPAGRPTRLIIDLTGLEFIDSRGLTTLVHIQTRASASGERLSFRHGPHVAQQPVGLTRKVQPQPLRADVSDEDSYFALAMACADVDRPRPGDRPGGTLTRSPTPAAGASDAPPSFGRRSRRATPQHLQRPNQPCSGVSEVRAQ